MGHCVEGGTFVATSNQDDMDLCQKSKVAASFALMSLALCLMAFYQTSVRSYFGMKASHGWAMICQFFICKSGGETGTGQTERAPGPWAGVMAQGTLRFQPNLIASAGPPHTCPPPPRTVIFSIVSWASWTSWQTQFNDQDVRLPGRTRINELKLGTGPVLMILVMLLAAWNTWLEKNAYNDEQAEDVRVRCRAEDFFSPCRGYRIVLPAMPTYQPPLPASPPPPHPHSPALCCTCQPDGEARAPRLRRRERQRPACVVRLDPLWRQRGRVHQRAGARPPPGQAPAAGLGLGGVEPRRQRRCGHRRRLKTCGSVAGCATSAFRSPLHPVTCLSPPFYTRLSPPLVLSLCRSSRYCRVLDHPLHYRSTL